MRRNCDFCVGRVAEDCYNFFLKKNTFVAIVSHNYFYKIFINSGGFWKFEKDSGKRVLLLNRELSPLFRWANCKSIVHL